MADKKIKPQHLDLLGNVISLDRLAAVPIGNHLKIARVVKLNNKMIGCNLIDRKGSYTSVDVNRYPNDIILISDEDATIFLLHRTK